MNEYEFFPEYKIGQRIYHLIPESPVGIIIDISYKVSTKEIQYLIATSWSDECWALERELSNEKIIV